MIVSLQPNLVLACGKLHQAYIEELLSAGLNVLDFFPRTLRELLDGMETLTDIAGAGRTGRELVGVRQTQGFLNHVRSSGDHSRPPVMPV
jgi:ABC-type Fe3+-hydroxamate transport system substrate-binding protein